MKTTYDVVFIWFSSVVVYQRKKWHRSTLSKTISFWFLIPIPIVIFFIFFVSISILIVSESEQNVKKFETQNFCIALCSVSPVIPADLF